MLTNDRPPLENAPAWISTALLRLAGCSTWGYDALSPFTSSEPAALSALALMAWDQDATKPLQWLLDTQAADGSVGVSREERQPAWTTAWAVLAWNGAAVKGLRKSGENVNRLARVEAPAYQEAALRGMDWLLRSKGEIVEQQGTAKHNSALVGWSYVANTHSWCEPTSLALLALRTMGQSHHPRAQEGAALLKDRLLPTGGANYGNTMVLGQWLRPHLQPSGLALWALGSEAAADDRVKATVDYLLHEAAAEQSAASLCYALLGLAAQHRIPGFAIQQLNARGQMRSVEKESAYVLALLTLTMAVVQHKAELPHIAAHDFSCTTGAA